MNISKELNNLITEVPKYSPTTEDLKKIEIEGESVFIISKLKSTKYLGSKIPEVLFDKVEKIVNVAVNEKKPIHGLGRGF